MTDQNPFNKSIMVALLGKPNAGKSSLVNYLLGFDLSIVTNKPQTTRNHFHCAFTVDHTEVILVDTPGIHKSNLELNKRMNGQAEEATEGVDLNLVLFDLTKNTTQDALDIAAGLEGKALCTSWVVFTKADLIEVDEEKIAAKFEKIKEILPSVERYFVISNEEGTNIHLLTGALCDEAQEGPHLYPNGEVSNKNERFFASEYIREQAFKILKDEVPYELAVVIDEYKDLNQRDDEGNKSKLSSNISASILVNRPSQRAIVVGRQGSNVKEIGTRARRKIEAMVGGKVNLNLHVKVSPKWFRNNFVLEEIGLPRVQSSTRVWRKR